MRLSGRTMSLLSKPFDHGEGPSHSSIELVFAEADASDFLPEEGNKMARVLGGLKKLAAKAGDPLAPDYDRKLEALVSGLAVMLMAKGVVDVDELDAALTKDGLSTYQGKPVEKAEPVDKLALFLTELFGDSARFRIARNHYEQATRACERHDWEAANGQFRSACDASFDALAHLKGCPRTRRAAAPASGYRKMVISRTTRPSWSSRSWRSPGATARTPASRRSPTLSSDGTWRRHSSASPS